MVSTRLGTCYGTHPPLHIFLKQDVEFMRPDGFTEIRIHSGCQTSLTIARHRVRSQGDHFLMLPRPFFLFPDGCCCRKTVHFWHLEIHEHQIKAFLLQRQECLAPVGCYHYSMSSLFE